MEKREFGKTGMKVSVLGFGGAEIGFEGASQNTVERILHEALDQGLNVLDTAECYVNSEELIGNTVSRRRKDFYLFTKCGHKGSYDVPAWTAAEIEASIDQSLRRLRTDYLDLIQLHSCSEETLRKGEVIEALQKAKAAGKARFIGYSGDGAAAVYAIKSGAFDALQTSVNIADQEAIQLTLPLAQEKEMGVIVKRPVANVSWRHKTKPENTYYHEYWDRLNDLKYDFINGNLPLSVEKALRFTLSVPHVHTMIVGTTKPGRWRENADVIAKGALPKDEYEAIRNKWKKVAGADWIGQS